MIQKEGINNFLGSRVQSTSKDSTCPWIENNVFGEKNEKEFIWGRSYGWSERYGEGYNHFSLYVDEALNLNDKNAFWAKVNEVEQEREEAKRKTENELKNTQTELERVRKQNEFLMKQLEEQKAQIQQSEYPPNCQ